MDARRLRQGEILFWESSIVQQWDWFNHVFKSSSETLFFDTFLSLHVSTETEFITIELKKAFPVMQAADPNKPSLLQIHKLIERIFTYRIQQRDYN